MVAAQASIGNQEADTQADIAIADSSSGGKHRKIVPDIGTWPFNFAKLFHNIIHWSITAALYGK